MRYFVRVTTFLWFILTSSFLTAQTSTEGTVFWLGYLENLNLLFNDAPDFTISVSASVPTTGTIEVPATGASLPFSVPAGVTEVDLFPAVLYSDGSNITDNKGVLITTDQPVRINAHHYRSFFCESSSVYPVSELGTNYRITTPMGEENTTQPNSFVIVATEDDTELEIVPTAFTLGLFPADVPISITLNRGQNYQVQATGDLTNSRVTSISGQPVAVFAGAREANVDYNCNAGANSHVWDQVPPIEHFSTLYHFAPFYSQGGDILKILALEDNTEVFFDCEQATVLNAGESYTVARNTATVITSTSPVSLTQYNTEGGCNPLNYGDPNGLNYLPAALKSNTFSWFSSNRFKQDPLGDQLYFQRHGVTIIAPVAAQNEITLDGDVLSGFSPFPGDPATVFLSIMVDGGTHEINSPQLPVQAYAYGFNSYDAYTMNLGYTVNQPPNFICGCDPSSGSSIISANLACAGDTSSFSFTTNYLNVQTSYWVVEGDTIFGGLAEYEHVFDSAGMYTIEVAVVTEEGCVYANERIVAIETCQDPCLGLDPNLTFFAPDLNCIDSLLVFGAIINNDVGVADSIRWTSTSGDTYFGDTLQLIFADAGNTDFVVEYFVNGSCVFTYNYALMIENCAVDCAVSPPALTVFGDTACVDSSLTFGVTVANNISPVSQISWEEIQGGNALQGDTVSFTYTESGDYPWNCNVTLMNGCVYTIDAPLLLSVVNCDTTSISCEDEVPILRLDLLADTVCTARAIDLQLIVSDTNGGAIEHITLAYPEGGISVDSSRLSGFIPDASGDYTFTATVTKTNGCVYRDTFTINIQDCTVSDESCQLYWPNVFSPNGDGINDSFKPEIPFNCSLLAYQLRIFDRWGGEVFVTTNPADGWTGLARGKPFNSGTFIYQATYVLANGESINKSGPLTLIR